MEHTVKKQEVTDDNVQTSNSQKSNSKSWRTNPLVKAAVVEVFQRRPFGTVAAIFLDNFVFVGVSRCSPVDNFDPVMGAEVASSRAQISLAMHLNLIDPKRAKRLLGRTEERKHGLPAVMRLSREAFSRVFDLTPSAPATTDTVLTAAKSQPTISKTARAMNLSRKTTAKVKTPEVAQKSTSVRKPAKRSKKPPAKKTKKS